MTDEVNQLPGILRILFRAATPCRHSAQANTVFDDIEQLTVSHSLRAFFPHIWRGGVHLPPHGVVAAAVICMADCAVVRPMRSRLGKDFARVRDWIPLVFCTCRHSQASSSLGC